MLSAFIPLPPSWSSLPKLASPDLTADRDPPELPRRRSSSSSCPAHIGNSLPRRKSRASESPPASSSCPAHINRSRQEYEDHKRSLFEIRKAKEDLDRRIHDQNFATEGKNVPEEYWSKYGDNYEKHQNDGGAWESECVRLYCKGLVGEEVVRDSKVVVAGAGVAICDPRDNLVFEARKNLETFDGGLVRSDEAVELKAIIEGLNTALTYFGVEQCHVFL